MPILDTVEDSLAHFRPKSHRQFIVLNIARRFDDLPNLARYLNVCDQHPKNLLLEAARRAEARAPQESIPPQELFFRLLDEWSREEGP